MSDARRPFRVDSSRSRIYGADGLSRLRLGAAIHGERLKGVTDEVEIARNIVELYDPQWLDLELRRDFRIGSECDRMATLICRERAVVWGRVLTSVH